ncbi:MAG: AAA family ATPase [Planctomycetes bacterium]|nr:AAA family ATPase [Planctomycetota bacterium]
MEPIERALRRPEAYPPPVPPRVEVKETHASLVFLAGDRAYKVKKPVRYAFLDYSTLERRRRFCEEEVRLNRRLAPSVYLGVAPITADGRVRGEGDAVEYAVEMVRLPQDRMLDELLKRGAVTVADAERIADAVAEFHARADRHGSQPIDHLRSNLDDAARFLPSSWLAWLREEHERLRAELSPLLARRKAVDGHGDLHASNVCMTDRGIVIYDCIEFEPRFRIEDAAAEIAFLAMDFERHGAWDLSRAFVRRYAERSGDRDAERLLPLFKPYRACVRGLVESLRGAPGAGAYFRLAVSYGLGTFAILVCGLPGTGKSTFAREAARAFDMEHLRSDEIRKELLGIAPTEHWKGGFLEGPYAPDITELTYRKMRLKAAALLHAGRRVVADATFAQRAWRDAFEAAARDAGARCVVVHVTCPEEVVRARLAVRAGDKTEVSDADFAVYLKAKETFEPPETACPATPEAVIDQLLRSPKSLS